MEGYLCLEVGLLQLQAGGDKTCGLSNTNDLYCWGSNLNGSLVPQDDGAGGYEEPVATYFTNAVYLSSDVKRVAVGRNDDGYGNHICFIEASEDHDTVYCQGSQLFGMLGDGQYLPCLMTSSIIILAQVISPRCQNRNTWILLRAAPTRVW